MRTPHLIFSAIVIAATLTAQTNPAPLLNTPLKPDSAAPGSGGFTLTVNGTGFVSSSVVNWNGTPRVTSFVNGSQLTASILAADVATNQTASVTVTNPAPGGGTSKVAFFPVTTPTRYVAFSASTVVAPGPDGFNSLVTGDLNGDGKLDLVATSYPNLVVMLGNGDGTFQAPMVTACACAANSLVLADVNHDGKLDVVLAGGSRSDITVLLGKGDGTFNVYQTYPTDYDPYMLAVGDFNGDGNLDLAVICLTSSDTPDLDILLGNGDGTFQAAVINTTVQRPNTLAVGDLNGDGRLDLAIGGSAGINILLGNGDGSFQTPALIAGTYYSVTIADFNGDGILDLATLGDKAYILLGKGDGTFEPAVGYSAGREYPAGAVAGDFNGDGIVDLALAIDDLATGQSGQYVSGISILRGNGDGTFQAPDITSLFESFSEYPAVGDFNGDGRLDLGLYQFAPPSATEPSLSVCLQTDVAFSPGVLVFSPTQLGTTSAAKTLTVSNVGTAPFSIGGLALAGPNVSEFRVSSDACTGSTVPPSGTCAVSVTFSPTQPGAPIATINFTDGAIGSPQVVGLTGDATVLKTSRTDINFGTVPVSKGSPEEYFRVTNTSSAIVTVTGVSITGHDSSDFYQYNTCGTEIKPRETCSVVVQFVPTRKGSRKASALVGLQVVGSDPTPVRLSGTGS